MDKVTIALWAPNFAHKPANAAAWLAMLDRQMADAARAGSKVFVVPEYVSMQWLAFAAAYKGEAEANIRQAEIGLSLLPEAKNLALRHDMLLVFGTFPVLEKDEFRNRCHIVTPEGDVIAYDKLCLLPIEKGEMAIKPGNSLPVLQWRGLRIVTVICLDCELPALSARIAEIEPDLLLIPSQTTTEAGYRRVFDCAKARAIELACPVLVCGGVGIAMFPSGGQEPNVSGAACYLPCESTGVPNGILASFGPVATLGDDAGHLEIVKDVPVAECRALRAGKADVWPGKWSASHVEVSFVEPAMTGNAPRRAIV